MNDVGNPASMNIGGVRMARYKYIDTLVASFARNGWRYG
jgi:hypothetical protein